ncbi:acyltransferase [uncultured Pseudodesulfovibrio sp.]|uniref:acyltransferase n=1 Tax=uncultured Pseudodesulfovibrio sp. TaxID=2035858 RepID=UPI0029C6AA81|nr:acyltransferase [uncultured Pseudodesulfovibrio sp.]
MILKIVSRIIHKVCSAATSVAKPVYTHLSRLYWSERLGKFGENARIESPVHFTKPHNIQIGQDVTIRNGVVMQPRSMTISIGDGTGVNPYVCIYGAVTIGKLCLIAPMVMFAAGEHDITVDGVPVIKKPGIRKPIVVEDDVWIGANAVITGGVTIGKGAVVGAGAVVTKDVAPYEIVAGMPAKCIGTREAWNNGEGKYEFGQ